MKFFGSLGSDKFFKQNMKENLPPKIHRVFHAGGVGKNAKFHHLNLLGPALRNIRASWPEVQQRLNMSLFKSILENMCSRPRNRNLHCPRVSRSSGGAAPLIQFSKNAKRFRWALEMLGRRGNTVKIGILAVFGPRPWGDPPTPGRKRARGLIRRSAERSRFGRPAGIRFSGVSAAGRALTEMLLVQH